jgi:hypothetical protein
MAKQSPKPPTDRPSGWSATGRVRGGRRFLTSARWRGRRRQLTDLDAKLRQMTAVERAGDADHPGRVTAPPSMTRVGLFARKVPQPPERAARARGGPLCPQSLHDLRTVLTKRSILLIRRNSNPRILLEKGWLQPVRPKRIFGARVLLCCCFAKE